MLAGRTKEEILGDGESSMKALGFSDRTLNALRNRGVHTLEDLSGHNIEDYFSRPLIFSEAKVAEIILVLRENGVRIPTNRPEPDYWQGLLDRNKGIDFQTVWAGKCWHCGKAEVFGSTKVCDFCWGAIHSTLDVPWSFDWCSECDAPGEPLCDACYARMSSEGIERLQSTREVPRSVLRKFQPSENDRHFAKTVVERALADVWVHWGNVDKVKSENVASHVWAGRIFDRKFPDYSVLDARWSLPEQDPEADGVRTAWIWFAVLFFVPFGIFVGAALVWAANRRRDRALQHGFSTNDFHMARLAFEKEIADVVWRHADTVISTILKRASGDSSEAWRESVGGRWQPLAPLPEVPSRDISPTEAEQYVESVMLYLGLEGARITRQSRDGGVDVRSDLMLAQVKHQLAPVGVKVVREIHGVAASEEKRASVFARFGFTADAMSFGEKTGVFLFSYSPGLKAHTDESEKALKEGFPAILGH
jgi:hypothetical protein